MRFVGVMLAIIVGTATLGGGVAWAASDSLPGDLLYPVKIAVEDARLTFTAAPQDQIDLVLGFVEERVEEIQGLLEIEHPVPDEAIARMEQHIEQALAYAAQISSDQEMVDALKKNGGDPKLTVYPDARHDSWTETYNNPEFYEWLLKQKRTKHE